MRIAGDGGRGLDMPHPGRSPDYVIEKLTTTLHCLVKHQGDARARVRDCYLCFHTLREEDFPDELRGDFRWIMKTITRAGPVTVGEKVWGGSVENTMRQSRNVTAARVADRIWKLYWATSKNIAYE